MNNPIYTSTGLLLLHLSNFDTRIHKLRIEEHRIELKILRIVYGASLELSGDVMIQFKIVYHDTDVGVDSSLYFLYIDYKTEIGFLLIHRIHDLYLETLKS